MTDLEIIRADRAARCAFWRERGVYADFTYGDAFRESREKHADTRMLFHSRVRQESATVAEAYEASERLASALHHLGLKRGDAFAIMLPTWYDALLGYMAALKLGVTLIPIVAIYGGREIGFIMRQTKAKALLVPDQWRGHDYLERVTQGGDMPDLEHLLVIGERRPAGAVDWDQLRIHAGTDYPRDAARSDDLSCIVYTSGTTSDPKGVKHTHNTQLCDINAGRATNEAPLMRVVVPAGSGPALSVFPAGHIAGFLGMLKPILYGGDCIFMDHWVPEDAVQLIEEHRVSSSLGTPIFLSSIIKAAETTGRDISSLKNFDLGASAITPENVRWTDQLGFPSGRTYGMTELPVISTGGGSTFEKRAFTDGKITPRNEVRILDDKDNDLPLGEVGEIAARGPRLFMGYVDESLDVASFLPGGWFKTGDIGFLDAENYLTITDRKKDIIIRGGENISSKEVEDILATIPGVVESAVTAMPDPQMGERVCAFVVLKTGLSLTLAEVDAHFRKSGAARQKTPERLILVEELPRTPSGKVKKVDLRNQLRAEVAAA